MNDGKNTEEKIVEAARKVFLEKGMDGTRMQEIANEAKINKSLLHYYYRSKEKLFNAVFAFAFKKFLPSIENIIESDVSIFNKIEILTDRYISLLMKNPFVPMFILREMNRSPDRLYGLIKNTGINPQNFIQQLSEEIEKGNIINIEPVQLITNILSLCVFPVAARPLLKRVFFDNDDKRYEIFLEGRKKEVARFIINAVKKEDK